MDINTRIGHDQRDEAVRRLQDHLAEGRLEMDEFTNPMERAMTARTIGDLIDIFDDLPDEDWMIETDEQGGRGADRAQPQRASDRRQTASGVRSSVTSRCVGRVSAT